MTKIRKLRVTLEGKTYDMVVEILDDAEAPSSAPWAQGPAYAPPAPQPVVAHAPAPAPEPTSIAAAPGDVGAPVAGKVTEIHVAVGAAVGMGDKLITMEAMKMFVDVCAPADGKVEAVNCAVGDVVSEGHPVVKLA